MIYYICVVNVSPYGVWFIILVMVMSGSESMQRWRGMDRKNWGSCNEVLVDMFGLIKDLTVSIDALNESICDVRRIQDELSSVVCVVRDDVRRLKSERVVVDALRLMNKPVYNEVYVSNVIIVNACVV